MLLVPIPFAARVWALPFMTVLAASERYNTEHGKPHRKLTDWARVMLRTVRRWFPQRQLVVVADSAYAVIDWLAGLQKLPVPITVITRLRLDAALYTPVGQRKSGQKGRPGVKGIRLPTLGALLENPETVWTRIRVLNWYGQGDRAVEISSQTAVWYHKGIQPVNIRWVLIRDPDGKFKSQALLCTDVTLEPTLILEWFVLRWCVEVTFEESRAHLGVESRRAMHAGRDGNGLGWQLLGRHLFCLGCFRWWPCWVSIVGSRLGSVFVRLLGTRRACQHFRMRWLRFGVSCGLVRVS